MLTEDHKNDIQTAYRKFLAGRGFQARKCQTQMIAEVARTLAAAADAEQRPATVIEAGTGTGKTVAYLIPAICLAQSLNKKLVISTATVALQEQLFFSDLPDIKQHSGLSFTYALAKGRGRYLCLSKMESLLRGQSWLGLRGEETEDASDYDIENYQRMSERFEEGNWQGDFDSWDQKLDQASRGKLSADYRQCLGRYCSLYSKCVFYRAREEISGADIIVANHDLVLADAASGSSVLPPPENCFFVFDEAHHLPDKAAGHLSHSLAVDSTRSRLERLPTELSDILAKAEKEGRIPAGQVEALCEDAGEVAGDAAYLLGHCQDLLSAERSFPAGQGQLRYAGLSEGFRAEAAEMRNACDRLSALLNRACQLLEGAAAASSEAERENLDAGLLQIKPMLSEADEARGLWKAYSEEDPADRSPLARWAQQNSENQDFILHASPTMVSDELQSLLWQNCGALVLTSATLSVRGDFTRFCERTGLPASANCTSLESPFQFAEQGLLSIPAMRHDPTDEGHSEEVIELLPGLISEGAGNLVLFNAWQELQRVQAGLPAELQKSLLLQDQLEKQELLKRHRERVDQGLTSIIFGVASFAEGIDLPGDYCVHVIIARLPFGVPDDPVNATLGAWVRSQERNDFAEITVPDVSLRLIQATGRLLRTENDRGRISILDRRLRTRAYGRRMLEALPPYRRERLRSGPAG